MFKKISLILLMVGIMVGQSMAAPPVVDFGNIPKTVNIQGRLTKDKAAVKNEPLTFTLIDGANSQLITSIPAEVLTDENGNFNAMLDLTSVYPNNDKTLFTKGYKVSIYATVAKQTFLQDLVSVPYAINSERLGGLLPSDVGGANAHIVATNPLGEVYVTNSVNVEKNIVARGKIYEGGKALDQKYMLTGAAVGFNDGLLVTHDTQAIKGVINNTNNFVTGALGNKVVSNANNYYYGVAGNANGVAGAALQVGVYGTGTNNGVRGYSNADFTGINAANINAVGVYGESVKGISIFGVKRDDADNDANAAIIGKNEETNLNLSWPYTSGVSGLSEKGYGVIGTSNDYDGVCGETLSPNRAGVVGFNSDMNCFGMLGTKANINGAMIATGVRGESPEIGVYGKGDFAAGYFKGKVLVSESVGIGTKEPAAKLDVVGDGNDWQSGFLFLRNKNGKDAGIRLYNDATTKFHIFNDAGASDKLRIAPAGDYSTGGITIKQNGSVGIGSAEPLAKLTVSTSQRSSAIIGKNYKDAGVGVYGECNENEPGFIVNALGIEDRAKGVYGKSREGWGVVGISERSHAILARTNSANVAAMVAYNSEGGPALELQGGGMKTPTNRTSEFGWAVTRTDAPSRSHRAATVQAEAAMSGTLTIPASPDPGGYPYADTTITVNSTVVKADSQLFIYSPNGTTVIVTGQQNGSFTMRYFSAGATKINYLIIN